MRVNAFAATAPKGALQPYAYQAGSLGPHDVELEITHCGLCHSDLHLIDDDWKRSSYPLVPGHEIVGIVRARGVEVTHLAVGDRAGVGWQRSACMICALCLAGCENLCAAQQATCVGNHGGMADRMCTDARFAFPIPGGIESALAAPLLCGGVTVYAPLRRHRVDATRTVGVVGVGGLGHLALAFLRALGSEIVAFSTSEDKKSEALRLGAHEFARSNDARDLRRYANRFDLVLSTAPARLDWISYLQALKPNGVLCLVGAAPGLLQLPAALLLTGQKSICGSDIGDRATIVEMLRFAERHRIVPTVETIAMSEVNHAIERLRRSEVRYRAVLRG
jgi:uncharacterized zinc-type alcohol dehydrogenase-like protein